MWWGSPMLINVAISDVFKTWCSNFIDAQDLNYSTGPKDCIWFDNLYFAEIHLQWKVQAGDNLL